MSNAVLTTPEVPFESRGLDKKVTLWERLRKGDEVAHLITLAGGWSILVITALLVQHLCLLPPFPSRFWLAFSGR